LQRWRDACAAKPGLSHSIVNTDQNTSLNAETKKASKEPSLWWKKLGWRKWLLFILFPIPIGPWWQTLVWTVLFFILAWLLIKNSIQRPESPPKPN
jgi:hypothetical protein